MTECVFLLRLHVAQRFFQNATKRESSISPDDSDNPSVETTYYRYCRGQDGKLHPVDIAKRNGRPVPLFPRSAFEPEQAIERDDLRPEYLETVDVVTYDLTELQRKTFLKLTIDGLSIMDVAKGEQVTRAAIYARIKAMIRRNVFVRAWWINKNKINQHA